MDLRTSENYWPLKNGLLHSYPSLNEDIKTDIVIIGAGISGAILSEFLSKEDFEIVVLDKRHTAFGSTSASTALIQYEIDTPLKDLIKNVGVDHAVRSYQLCVNAIGELKKICDQFPDKSDFNLRPSFQITSYKSHLKNHQEELELRRLHQISHVQWLSSKDIKEKYGINKLGGIFSQDGAVLDPFKLTHLLLKKNLKRNIRVFENTEVLQIKHQNKGVELICSQNFKIKAKKLIIAAGYESQKYLPKKVEIPKCSYAIVSEPVKEKKLWHENSMIWETASPYLYMRTTSDNRIIVGGKDDPTHNAKRRDQNLAKKSKELQAQFKDLFPAIDFKMDFTWAGFFCETKDGLPFIGSIPERPHTYFSLGFGGNGITYSVIAAQIIRDLVRGKKNDDSEIFKFNR